jgi:hypothetical protein
MRLNRLVLALASLVFLVACSRFPFFERTEASSTESAPKAQVELQNVRYDGQRFSGRLLVSAVDQELFLDRRLIEESSLTTEAVSDCARNQPVKFIVMDVYARSPGREDTLVLKPGYWYGKDVSILLFAEDPSQAASPDCVEAEFAFHALGGKTAATLRVRALRDPRPASETGTPSDAGTPSDGGVTPAPTRFTSPPRGRRDPTPGRRKARHAREPAPYA